MQVKHTHPSTCLQGTFSPALKCHQTTPRKCLEDFPVFSKRELVKLSILTSIHPSLRSLHPEIFERGYTLDCSAHPLTPPSPNFPVSYVGLHTQTCKLCPPYSLLVVFTHLNFEIWNVHKFQLPLVCTLTLQNFDQGTLQPSYFSFFPGGLENGSIM